MNNNVSLPNISIQKLVFNFCYCFEKTKQYIFGLKYTHKIRTLIGEKTQEKSTIQHPSNLYKL